MKPVFLLGQRGTFLALILLLATPRCMAQPPVPDLSEASLEQLMNIKVYSASKHLQSTGEAPSSVTIVTAAEIQKHGYRTLADILRSVRGFYVTYDRDYSYVGVRGFGRPGDYNTRVLLLVDGHRINDNIYDQAMLGTEFPVDVDLIERVEVVRGPSSSLYGSNAFFAVINVITKRSHDLNGLELSFEPGSFASYKGRASYGGAFKGTEILLSGTFYSSAGQTLFFPEFNTPAGDNGIARQLDYDERHDLFFTATHGRFTLQGVTSRREKGIPTAPYDTLFNDPRTHSVDQHQYLDLGYHLDLAHGLEFLARTYYDRYAYDGIWPFPGQELNVDYSRGQKWGSELQVSRILRQRHRLTFGGEVRDNFQQDQKNYDLNASTAYVTDRRSSWMGAGFIQEEYAVRHQLTLSAGVRYDRYSRYGGSTNPRIGLIYHPLETTALKLLYGSAFRVPNVYEAYYGAQNDGVSGVYGLNPDLGPESIRNLEAIWEQELRQHYRVTVSAFRNYISDLISLQTDPLTGRLVFRNADDAHSGGVEFEAQARYSNEVTGRLSYCFTETKDEKRNEILVNSPHHLGKIALSAPLRRRRVFASVEAQYQSARRTLQGHFLPAFPVVNATLFGHALNKRLDLSASIYNLFDRTYFDVGPEEDRQDRLQQDGRNFRLKLTWRFGGHR